LRGVNADIAAALADYTDRVLVGDVWERPGLSPRDRILITAADLSRALSDKRVAVPPEEGSRQRRYARGADRASHASRVPFYESRVPPFDSHGKIGERIITAAEVARTFKRIAKDIELVPTRPLSRISAHSTRIGAAQDRTAAGAALPETKVAGGWKSPQVLAHYARKLDARQGAIRRWLEVARKRETDKA
jgi:hypothetical protein